MMSAQPSLMPFPARLRTSLTIDPLLLTLALALLLGGFIILASASVAVSDAAVGNPFFYLERQAVAAALGIAAGAICLFIPMQMWRTLGPLLLLLAFALLIVVLLPGVGHTVNGSTRWLRVGFMNLQVSEPARLALILCLASYLVRHNKSLRERFAGFARPMLILSFACALLLAEPDFGAAIVLLATSLAMLFVAGARFRDFFAFFGAAVLAMATLAITSPYRLKRLTGFMDPWADPFNSGFQLTQSLIAIGRGEWFGVGLGDSVQKLFYLPEAHTDFVFAVFAEEFGLLGVLLLIAVFALLLWRIANLAHRAAQAERFYEAYVAIGLGTWLGLQAFINIGVNMGLLPTKGLTLPLISYGRSSMIITMIAIAILLRIHHELATDAAPSNRRRKSKSKSKSKNVSRTGTRKRA
ncbi:MAG: putative lipid II flippase FtsW [Woeseia sp.]|nr:putative lipid II flippase FtsW [Woeseia sp.]MBT8096764.1 putative lipid II flippase FtsW [Woeseia sp.]NNE59800.1 putative lipid II flippase FtsW [Woeseia sp.]NNL55968.1 putative lipid II flippase FtsW [Woeseia sp.]